MTVNGFIGMLLVEGSVIVFVIGFVAGFNAMRQLQERKRQKNMRARLAEWRDDAKRTA